MSKYIARQVAPEEQSAPDMDMYYAHEAIALWGNPRMEEHTIDLIDTLRSMYSAIDDDMDDIVDSEYNTQADAIREVIRDYFGSAVADNSVNLTDFYGAIEMFTCSAERSHTELEGAARVMSILTGKKWYDFTIRGCVQSEWQSGVTCMTHEELKEFECAYWNTGEEYAVTAVYDDGDEDTVYVYITDTLNVEKELRNAMWIDSTEILEVYKFTHYTNIPQYKREV